MHVQLTSEAAAEHAVEQTLLRQLPDRARPMRLVLWPYARFPFGMGLDYERKFALRAGREEPASGSAAGVTRADKSASRSDKRAPRTDQRRRTAPKSAPVADYVAVRVGRPRCGL